MSHPAKDKFLKFGPRTVFVITVTAFLATFIVFTIQSESSRAYAQTPSPGAMTQTTSGKGSLIVAVEPSWNTDPVQFKVSFLDPKTNQLHQHQDYDFVITKDGKEVFRASQQANQPVLHNAEGVVTIPFKFDQQGAYAVQVSVLGLGLPPTPIKPETATFNVNVTPEFPAVSGSFAAMAIVFSLVAFVAIKTRVPGYAK